MWSFLIKTRKLIKSGEYSFTACADTNGLYKVNLSNGDTDIFKFIQS